MSTTHYYIQNNNTIMGQWHGKEIDTFSWQGYDWAKRPIWGDNHPNDDFTWYSTELYEIRPNGDLVLPIAYQPKIFNVNGRMVEKPWARCSVRTTEEFKYGIFEWEMKCPEGKWQWPALWLASDLSWPPEIDCMEGWSEDTRDYVKMLIFRNIKPTIHWTAADGSHQQKQKKNILRCCLKCGKTFDKYKVVWTPEYIDVYYNKTRVAHFTEKKLLDQLNDPDCKMHPIMSSGPYGKFDQMEMDRLDSNDRHMIVRSFKYTPL